MEITKDAEILSEIFEKLGGLEITPEEIMILGYGYALTELTPSEAKRLGAKAYLQARRSKCKV